MKKILLIALTTLAVQAQFLLDPYRFSSGPCSVSCSGCSQYLTEHTGTFAGGNNMIYTNTAIAGVVDSKTITVSFWVNADVLAGTGSTLFEINSNTTLRFRVGINSTEAFTIDGFNSAGSQILQGATADSAIATGGWYHVLWAIDMADTTKRYCFVNGTCQNMTWLNYTDDTLDLVPTTPIRAVGNDYGTQTTGLDGSMAALWFDDVYNDNVCDYYCTGCPVDLGANGENPTGAAPAIYLARLGSGPDWRTDASGNGNHFSSAIGVLTSVDPPCDPP